jgi:hypothetical protein
VSGGKIIGSAGILCALSAMGVACGGDGGTTATQSTVRPAKSGDRGPAPRLVSVRNLRTLSSQRPIYWAGKRNGFRYELIRAPTYTFIRYLPRGAPAGAPGTRFLTIGTFRRPKAFTSLSLLAKRTERYRAMRLSHAGVALYAKDRPKLVYFAYPRSRIQVQVFDPSPGAARRLVVGGQIRPIR